MEMTVYPTLFYASTLEILTLLYSSSVNKVPFPEGARTPRIVHCRELPPPVPLHHRATTSKANSKAFFKTSVFIQIQTQLN